MIGNDNERRNEHKSNEFVPNIGDSSSYCCSAAMYWKRSNSPSCTSKKSIKSGSAFMHMIGHDNNRRRKHMLHIIRVIVDIPSSKLGEMIGGQVRKFFQELTFQELEFLRKRHFSQLCEFWKSAFLGFPRKTKYFRHITLDNLSSSWEKAKINIKNFTHNDRSEPSFSFR